MPEIIPPFILLLYYCAIKLHEVHPVIFLHSSCLDTYCFGSLSSLKYSVLYRQLSVLELDTVCIFSSENLFFLGPSTQNVCAGKGRIRNLHSFRRELYAKQPPCTSSARLIFSNCPSCSPWQSPNLLQPLTGHTHRAACGQACRT